MRPPTSSFRDMLRRLIWPAVVMMLTFLVFWRPSVPIASIEQDIQPSAADRAAMSQVWGTPWHHGLATARFTLILAATPTLYLRDERTGESLRLQGPIPGDALLSAMDLLVADDPVSELAEMTELSAVPDGNKPR